MTEEHEEHEVIKKNKTPHKQNTTGITLDLSLSLDEYLNTLPAEKRAAFEAEYNRVYEEYMKSGE